MTTKNPKNKAKDIDQVDITKIVNKAKESFHSEAILHLYSNKHIVRDQFLRILKEYEKEHGKISEPVKRLLAYSCEFAYQGAIKILAEDRNDSSDKKKEDDK